MKVALCYSGQIGGLKKAIHNQRKCFLKDSFDVYAYTSNLVSHKGLSQPHINPNSEVHEYLKGGVGWRKHLPSYGIVYKIKNTTVQDSLNLLNPIKQFIENESLEDTLNDSDMTKWEWLRKRQLKKMHECNKMITGNYDIVVRSRFEFSPYINIGIEDIYKKHGNDNRIFAFGGWSCVPPMVFMNPFFCDGFVFGSPKAMNVFTSLYLNKEAYPFDPKYKECWDKYGDNVEYQLKKHLEKNNIELIYIGGQRSMYHLER
jgi:hypothetical protein